MSKNPYMARRTSSQNPLRKLLNIWLTFGTLYSIVISVILLMRSRITEANKLIGYFNSFAHMLMLPTLILMPINLLLRPWSAWFQVLPVASLIAAYGRLFVPRQPVIGSKAKHTIKVMTFNLHGEAQILEPILDILRTSDADIISVQELSIGAADCFKSSLIDIYPHQALHTAKQPNRGQGILSRYPIPTQHYWRNPHIAPHSIGHLRVEIDFSGTPITLYNTHPPHPGLADDGFNMGPRGQEIDIVLEQAAKDSSPVLIMGDFNMTDQNEDYQRITARFGDSFREVGSGMGFTFPDLSTFQSLPDYWPLPIRLFPFLRLDYVFHDAGFRPLRAYVWSSAGGSDHRPVWVELALITGDNE
jgi:endonuclease/exonuclease/phosphatase family metal-dependent hydrolase